MDRKEYIQGIVIGVSAYGLIWIGIGFFIYSQVLFLKETSDN
jgi:preprotein translocase subunit Sss1